MLTLALDKMVRGGWSVDVINIIVSLAKRGGVAFVFVRFRPPPQQACQPPPHPYIVTHIQTWWPPLMISCHIMSTY